MTRLDAVVLDAEAIVDRQGRAFADVEASLLAAHEAGLRVIALERPEGPPLSPVVSALPADVEIVTAAPTRPGLQRALRAAHLDPGATLHIVARDDVAAATAGTRTAWLNRAGTALRTAADEEWRDLLDLVALCRATPRRPQPLLRC